MSIISLLQASLVDIVGFIAAFCSTFSFLPQIIKTIKTKSASDISYSMLGMSWFGVTLWLIYGINIGNNPLIIANGVTFLIISTMFFVKILFEKRQRAFAKK